MTSKQIENGFISMYGSGFNSDIKKKELEEAINNSEFFALSEDINLGRREIVKNKLISDLSEYGLNCCDLAGEFGQEAWEVALRCVDAYNPSKGVKLADYYKAALEFELKIANAERYQREKYRYMSGIDHKRLSKVNTYIDEARRYNISISSESFIKELSEKLNCTKKTVTEYIALSLNTSVISVIEDDGDEVDVTEIIPAKDQYYEGPGISEILSALDNVYLSEHEKGKKLCAALFTSYVYKAAVDNYALMELLLKQSFFDENTYKICKFKGRSLADKEIADLLERTQQSVSESKKRLFQNKLLAKLNPNTRTPE